METTVGSGSFRVVRAGRFHQHQGLRMVGDQAVVLGADVQTDHVHGAPGPGAALSATDAAP